MVSPLHGNIRECVTQLSPVNKDNFSWFHICAFPATITSAEKLDITIEDGYDNVFGYAQLHLYQYLLRNLPKEEFDDDLVLYDQLENVNKAGHEVGTLDVRL